MRTDHRHPPHRPDRRRLVLSLLLSGLCPVAVRAQELPDTVRLIVPSPAGGVVDGVGRQFAPAFARALGAQLALDNVAGASGAIGIRKLLAGAVPGADVALGSDAEALLVPLANPQLKYQPSDLRLIGLVGSAPMLLVASPRLASDSLAGVLRAARGLGAIAPSIGTAGIDSSSDLLAGELAARTGMPLLNVPFRGVAPLVQNLVGGQVDLAFVPFAGAVPALVASGGLRPLALAAATRVSQLPGVPTLHESIGSTGFDYTSWLGVLVARPTPETVARAFSAALQATLYDDALRVALRATGSTPARPMTLDQAETFFVGAAEAYRPLLEQARAARLSS